MNNATLIDIDPDNVVSANDFLMSKTLAEALHKHYPGHLWGVNVESRTGLLHIRDLYLAGNWAYVIKLGAIYSASSLEKDVIRAGGEILERFNMARGAFNEAKYSTAPTDFAGRLLFDKS